MKRYAIYFSVSAALLCGCSDDVPNDYSIKVENGTINQIIFAFPSQKVQRGMVLTMGGPWHAELVQSTLGDNDWLELWNNYGDKAGHYNVGLTMQVNETGYDRRATVMLTCGETQQVAYIIQRTSNGSIKEDEESQVWYGTKTANVVASYNTPKASLSFVAQGDVKITGNLITQASVSERIVAYSYGFTRYKAGGNTDRVLTMYAYRDMVARNVRSGVPGDTLTLSLTPQLNYVTLAFSVQKNLERGELVQFFITYTGY
jgi:hypothetical protein